MENSSRNGNIRPLKLPPGKPGCGLRSNAEMDMEQWTGSKAGKEYIKAAYCHLAYFNSRQSTSCKMPGWMKHRLESRLLGDISITSDMQMKHPYGRK